MVLLQQSSMLNVVDLETVLVEPGDVTDLINIVLITIVWSDIPGYYSATDKVVI